MGLASAAAVRDGLIAAGRDRGNACCGSGARHAAGCPCGARPARRIVHPRGVGRRRSRAPRDRRGGGALDRVARRAGAARRATGGRMTSPHETEAQDQRPGRRDREPPHRRRRDLSHRRRRLDHRSRRRRRGDDRAGRAGPAQGRGRRRRRRGRRLTSRRSSSTADRRVLPGNLRERIRLRRPTIELPGRFLSEASHVRLRRIRLDIPRSADFRVPRSGAPPPVRRADRGRVQAAAPAQRRLSAAARLHAADRHSLRHAVVRADARARARRAPL